jgi:hypothetical protein
MAHDMIDHERSRRQFIKKAAYLAPAIVSLAVAPSYAKAGSDKNKDKDKDKTRDIKIK